MIEGQGDDDRTERASDLTGCIHASSDHACVPTSDIHANTPTSTQKKVRAGSRDPNEESRLAALPRIAKPAIASAPPPTPHLPQRRPCRRLMTSVVSPPKRSAATLRISGNPLSTLSSVDEKPWLLK